MANPIFMDCGNCGRRIILTGLNCMVVRYLEDDEFQHLLAECECGMWSRGWLDDETFRALLKRKMPLVEEPYAPGEVREAFCIDTGYPLPVTQELTKQQEHEVEFFHFLLERGDVS